jgi:hypothetical protein
MVRVYLGATLIKTHPRKGPGVRSTDVNDYPPGRSEHALRSVDRFLANAQ